MPANYLLHRVVIGRVSTGLSHTLSPFLFALEELMSCDTHQTALESRPAALPLPTVLRIADRGPPRAIVATITLFHVRNRAHQIPSTFYYLADKQMELSKTLYNRRAKIKESEQIRMETRRNTRGEYLEDYLRVLYIYRIHIKTKTNDLFKKGKNKIKIQFSFERDTHVSFEVSARI